MANSKDQNKLFDDIHWQMDILQNIDVGLVVMQVFDRLAGGGAMLVGIDSHNIDDTRGRTRPVHSRLLGSGVLIVEHMCSLEALPEGPFRFHAAPPRIRAFGTFPVRAYAEDGTLLIGRAAKAHPRATNPRVRHNGNDRRPWRHLNPIL